MDNSSFHYHNYTYLGNGQYSNHHVGDISMTILTSPQRVVGYANCDKYHTWTEREDDRGKLYVGEMDNGTCDATGDYILGSWDWVYHKDFSSSGYNEFMRMSDGNQIREYHWIFNYEGPNTTDTTPPNVVSVYPADNQSSVSE